MKRSVATLLLALATACAGRKESRLPPPQYEQPTLPHWEAPPPAEDPLDAIEMEGEWVEEPASPTSASNREDGVHSAELGDENGQETSEPTPGEDASAGRVDATVADPSEKPVSPENKAERANDREITSLEQAN